MPDIKKVESLDDYYAQIPVQPQGSSDAEKKGGMKLKIKAKIRITTKLLHVIHQDMKDNHHQNY